MALPVSIFKTRIQSKFDHISAWNAHGSFVPLAGEIMVAYVPEMPPLFSPEEGTEGVQAPPKQFLLKVGDGSTPLSDLQWITAKAGDVWEWAKTQNLEWDLISNDSFLSGLSSYIKQNSKNTAYTLSNDGSIEDPSHVILMASEEGQEPSAVASVMIPDAVEFLGDTYTDPDHLLPATNNVGSAILSVMFKRIVSNGYEYPTIVSLKDTICISTDNLPGENYAKRYQLIRNGIAITDSVIDIPKDYIVREATVRTIQQYFTSASYAVNDLLMNYPTDLSIYRVSSEIVSPTTWEDIQQYLDLTTIQSRTEYTVSVGQKVIDLEINTVSGLIEGTDHVYISVKDLLGDELDASVSGDVEIIDPEGDFFNVVSGVTVTEENGVLDSLSVRSTQLNKIALSGNAKYLTQDDGDYLIFDCGSATVLTANPPSPEPPAPLSTYMMFNDGTSQWYDFSGEITVQTMMDSGLWNDDTLTWIKSPISVEIGSNVTSIGNYTFTSCRDLKSITIPDSVTSIGINTFQECIQLSSVKLGKNIESIDMGAFSACENLPSITFGSKVTRINYQAFAVCPKLKSVTFEGKDKATVQGMKNYPWALTSGCEIHCTDGTIII